MGVTISLTIPRKELIGVLKMLRKHAKKKGAGEAILSYESGMLNIQISGVVARAEAQGKWSGEIRISGKLMANLWKSVPPGDPVELSVKDGRLNIGTMSVTCVWQLRGTTRILLPLGAPLPVILSAALKHSRVEIERSGLADVVLDAEEKRDELLYRAAKILEPLCVTPEELRSFVDDKLMCF